MRTPRRIGIDLDGVLIDHRPHKLLVAQESGFALEPWQANSNVMSRFIPTEKYLELLELVYGPLTKDAPQTEGAFMHLQGIRTELYIISARRAHSIRFAQDWLSAHRVYDVIPAERIVFCGSDDEKRGYCERLGIDLFLDDKVSVLESLPGRTVRVLYDEDGIAERLGVGERFPVATSWGAFREIAIGKGMA